jgi:hypothetical protein
MLRGQKVPSYTVIYCSFYCVPLEWSDWQGPLVRRAISSGSTSVGHTISSSSLTSSELPSWAITPICELLLSHVCSDCVATSTTTSSSLLIHACTLYSQLSVISSCMSYCIASCATIYTLGPSHPSVTLLLTSCSGLNAFLPVRLFVCFTFPLPFPTLLPCFCDNRLVSKCSISPLTLERHIES